MVASRSALPLVRDAPDGTAKIVRHPNRAVGTEATPNRRPQSEGVYDLRDRFEEIALALERFIP